MMPVPSRKWGGGASFVCFQISRLPFWKLVREGVEVEETPASLLLEGSVIDF